MPLRRVLVLLALSIPLTLAVWPHVAPAADVKPSAEVTSPYVVISPALRQPALDLPASVHDALRTRDWKTAAVGLKAMKQDTLVGAQKGDWAFVLAWALVRADRGVEAVGYLPLIEGADSVPLAYAALVRGEVLRANGQKLEALAALEEIAADSTAWPRASIERAEILRDLGRTQDAFAVYEAMVKRPDPSAGNSVALLALATRAGLGSPDAYPLLRRIWTYYPRSAEASDATAALVANYPLQKSTWQEVGQRAEVLMNAGDYAGAIAATDARAAEVDDKSIDACRFMLVRGRSLFKSAKLSLAVDAFGDIGPRCVAVDADYGPKGMYLKGQAQFKKKDFAGSAATNAKIGELYPKSSFADDGLTQAGIALQETGDLEAARKLWTKAMVEFPAGDTVPESAMRLSFALYMEGKPDDAQQVAEAVGKLPNSGDPLHVGAGRYWAARLLLYPDVANPTERVTDPVLTKRAVDGWASLCRDMPWNFYSILAYGRLKEVAPDVAAEVTKRPKDFNHGDRGEPWVVRLSFYENPAVREGVDLARLGLLKEAMAEWAVLDDETFTADEKAWLTELRIMDNDWLLAHDDMRGWLTSHPVSTLGDRQAQVLRVAYPDRYWKEVQANASGYSFEPRLFHALSREESNFNRGITSPVGARGLSQLMPPTAREVAGWLKIPYTPEKLDDPAYNAKLGARYFEAMHRQNGGSPYLALASYNAGGGRVNEWLAAWGDIPTDEYIERIPFRETRGYVKRVMGSWQIYRYQFDDGDLFYDLSAFNNYAKPPK